jgi:hypothetical protein
MLLLLLLICRLVQALLRAILMMGTSDTLLRRWRLFDPLLLHQVLQLQLLLPIALTSLLNIIQHPSTLPILGCT